MRRNLRQLWVVSFAVLAVTLACGLSIPGGTTADTIATSAAATLNALSGTAVSALTAVPHELPLTDTPSSGLPTLAPSEPAAPVRVSFATPDGSLYVWADGTSTPQLLVATDNVEATSISPDGQLVAFTRYAEYQFLSLEVIGFDGTGRRVLLDQAGAAALPRPPDAIGTSPSQMGWIPGTHILTLSVGHNFEGPGLILGNTFYRIDADTGSLESLLDTGNSTWQFVWSPDGSRVAISRPDGIGVYAANGSLVADTILSYPLVNTASEYAWTAHPTWSADGSTLIARVPPSDPFNATGSDANSTLWRLAADGLSGEQTFSGWMRYQMRGNTGVSPDLSRILYYIGMSTPNDDQSTLYLSDLYGGNGVVVANGQFEGEPSWSLDSLHFFYSLRESPDNHAYIGTLGADPQQVTDYANAKNAVWIDANRYLVVSNDGGRQRLLLGTIGMPTGLIYDSMSSSPNQLSFSVNR